MPAVMGPLRVGRLRPFSAALAYLLAILSPAGCGKDAPPPAPPIEVLVAEVRQQDVPVSDEFVGQIEGKTDIDIRARVEGFLTGIHFQEGTPVRRGQLLYTIDPSELQAKVAEAQARLAQAQATLANADADAKRIRPLAEINAVSRRDLDAAEAQLGAAQGGYDAAKASLDFAEIELGYTRIASPTDGVIGLSLARVGDFVGRYPNPVVLNTVSSLGDVRVRFSITEQQYLTLARGYRGPEHRAEAKQAHPLQLILADGTVHPDPGFLDVVNREVDPLTGAITFEAVFPNPGGILRPGQFARVRAVMETRSGALVIPQRAIVELQGMYRAFVVGPGDSVQVRPLVLGPAAGKLRVVEQGVAPGERVVVAGAMRLRPGMVVIPKPYVETPPGGSPTGAAGAPGTGAAAKPEPSTGSH